MRPEYFLSTAQWRTRLYPVSVYLPYTPAQLRLALRPLNHSSNFRSSEQRPLPEDVANQ